MSMKKKVLCIFSLVLYLLVACTIVSHWIEDQMMTQVTISERKNRGDSFSFKQTVLFADSQGEHLYELIDGSGWNSGLRVSMLPDASWYIDAFGGAVKYDGNKQLYRFITSASRMPKEGEAVKIIENIHKADDQYLCIFTHGVPEELILPKNSEIAARNETTLLLNMIEAEFPFFEHSAKGLSESLAEAGHIISLTDAKAFLNALPSLSAVVVILLAGIVVWAVSCLLSIRSGKHKWLLRVNVLLVIVLLCSLTFTLNQIELPASMLPTENIFDWQHYANLFSLLDNALMELGFQNYVEVPLGG